jgi:hypothetical protein
MATCLAGHQAKLARSFLAATYSNDVVTIGDLDHYIFQVNERGFASGVCCAMCA